MFLSHLIHSSQLWESKKHFLIIYRHSVNRVCRYPHQDVFDYSSVDDRN